MFICDYCGKSGSSITVVGGFNMCPMCYAEYISKLAIGSNDYYILCKEKDKLITKLQSENGKLKQSVPLIIKLNADDLDYEIQTEIQKSICRLKQESFWNLFGTEKEKSLNVDLQAKFFENIKQLVNCENFNNDNFDIINYYLNEFIKKTPKDIQKIKELFEKNKQIKDKIKKLELEKIAIKENNTKFKVGDRVQFKTWEEMEKELGLNEDGFINSSIYFTEKMEYLCGTYATIEKIYDDREIKLRDFKEKGYTNWAYSTDMVKKVKGDKL
ncbi:MAG: hypothetical protein M0R51_08660 [Clostridia bacterium]|jgi:hypothetical protein|nr:hypothetical protein [Clostridia bacterium]